MRATDLHDLSPTLRIAVLLLPLLLAIAVLWGHGAIPQDPLYHLFADGRRLFGVPNLLDVLSNLPFLLAGLYGLWEVVQLRRRNGAMGPVLIAATLFTAVLLTGLGSAWYHLAPDNASLLWDRLPMAMAFTSLLCLTIAERVLPRVALHLHGWLLPLGVATVLWWAWGEAQGHGDLRPYLLVQGYPMIAIPLLVLLYPRRQIAGAAYLGVLGLYLLAKLAELGDAQLFAMTGLISGHSLKHLIAAAAALVLARLVRRLG